MMLTFIWSFPPSNPRNRPKRVMKACQDVPKYYHSQHRNQGPNVKKMVADPVRVLELTLRQEPVYLVVKKEVNGLVARRPLARPQGRREEVGKYRGDVPTSCRKGVWGSAHPIGKTVLNVTKGRASMPPGMGVGPQARRIYAHLYGSIIHIDMA